MTDVNHDPGPSTRLSDARIASSAWGHASGSEGSSP
eukprot:ctg_6998.g673